MTPQETAQNEALEVAERDAHELLGVSFSDALKVLDAGQLDGTAIEANLRMHRFLLHR